MTAFLLLKYGEDREMIKNIIFDLGNVLISYEPESFIEKYVKEKNREKFYEVVFKSKEWLALDRGTLEYDEAFEIFSQKLPDEIESLRRLLKNNIQDVLFPLETNLNLLEELKKKYNLYILSNFHRESFLEIAKKCNFSNYFKGGVISYEIKLLKPEKEIYESILKKYNLIPEETLFIDDTQANVEAAQKMGIKIIHLREKNKLKEELLKKEIEL